MSCPEAVRRLLSDEDPIRFIESQMTPVKHIVNSHIDTNDKYYRNTMFQKLPELRTLSIEIIQNRSQILNERIMSLGKRLEEFNEIDSITDDIESVSDNFTDKYEFQMDFFKYAVESLGVFNEIDSPAFAEYSSLVLDKFESGDSEVYTKTINSIVKPFIEENSYIFEHYLVNSIFQNNFPFSESDNVFDGFTILFLVGE